MRNLLLALAGFVNVASAQPPTTPNEPDRAAAESPRAASAVSFDYFAYLRMLNGQLQYGRDELSIARQREADGRRERVVHMFPDSNLLGDAPRVGRAKGVLLELLNLLTRKLEVLSRVPPERHDAAWVAEFTATTGEIQQLLRDPLLRE
jgi:hypothetical protein